MFSVLLCLASLVFTVQSEGVCPGSEEPCAGTCTIRLSQTLSHGQAAVICKARNKRTYMGSRTNEQLENTCSSVFGGSSTQYIWTRYKLRDGLIVEETGVTIDRINWGIKYCGAVNKQGNFMVQPCSWTKRAVCVSNIMQYDKNNLRECGNEYYWVTEGANLPYDTAVQYCKQNNMQLATPYTTARKNCFSSVLQNQRPAVANAWIDYNITAATQAIKPWDIEYCIKVNSMNEYKIDRCETRLPVTCATFGELDATGVVVQRGKRAVLSCKCYNCTVNDIQWTDGMTVWRTNDNAGSVSVKAVTDSTGVRSTLTLSETNLDQVYTCTQNTPYTNSVIYTPVNVDVYNLEVTSHYVSYGAQITIACTFNNDKHLDIERVAWSDRRDNADLSGRAKTSWKQSSVISTLEILAEYYTHDVRCTFYARGEDLTAYEGISRIIVYKIEGTDQSVPANANTTLTCTLREHEGRNVDLVRPTRVDWVQGDSSYVIPSEVANSFKAVLVRNMRSGVDKYSCRFLFENGNILTKTLKVTAFDFEGVPDLVANGTTATLNCKYSKGAQLQDLWWEREGVRISDGKQYMAETYEITSTWVNQSYYIHTTVLTVKNATYAAMFHCAIRVSDKVWRKDIPLGVYMGVFIASNGTIVEKMDSLTGEILARCSVWANPRPNVQLFVDSAAEEGVLSNTDNMTSLEVRVDQTCTALQYKCLATNNVGSRTVTIKSKLNKKCGFFQKLSLTMWLIIGGVLLLLIIIIIIICCCFCRRTKKLKEEVEYQREVLSQVDGASTMYSMNLSRGGKAKGSVYEDMYSSEGGNHTYDPLVKAKKQYMELNDSEVGDYNEPFSEVGLMSPKYQRIESDYEPNAPLFMSRSKSRENMFSPPLLKKSGTALSYQNLREQSSGYPSAGSIQKSNLSRSAQNLLANNRKFPQPADDIGSQKMNPYGKVQRLPSVEPDNDEIMSITSRIPPSEISEMTPPVAIMSPRGWEIPADPVRMFSPPVPRRPRMEYERKFSEPAISPMHDAQEKVKNWNIPPTFEEVTEGEGLYDKPPKSGWSTPTPHSAVGESTGTGRSSATLDTISVTPTFLAKTPGNKPVTFPKPRIHPEDRVGDCKSPKSVASSSYAQSSVGPSVSQYLPSSGSQQHSAIENDRQKHNLQNNVFDIDDLSSVDVPDNNGMDTLDRRVHGSLQPAAENFYTPPRGGDQGPASRGGGGRGAGTRHGPTGVKVLPTLPTKPKLRTSHF